MDTFCPVCHHHVVLLYFVLIIARPFSILMVAVVNFEIYKSLAASKNKVNKIPTITL
jgi:hypothetical protein